ncbi:MAG: hypothetical protein RL417_2220, partial [Pseudomonadota bacterium]
EEPESVAAVRGTNVEALGYAPF